MINGWEGSLLDANGGRVLAPRGEPSIKVSDADAALIAAAPELLRRLQRQVGVHSVDPNCTWDDGKPCWNCDDAAFLTRLQGQPPAGKDR